MAYRTSFERLSKNDQRATLNQWNEEAKQLLKDEGIALIGNALKYYMLGYVQDRKDKLDGAHG